MQKFFIKKYFIHSLVSTTILTLSWMIVQRMHMHIITGAILAMICHVMWISQYERKWKTYASHILQRKIKETLQTYTKSTQNQSHNIQLQSLQSKLQHSRNLCLLLEKRLIQSQEQNIQLESNYFQNQNQNHRLLLELEQIKISAQEYQQLYRNLSHQYFELQQTQKSLIREYEVTIAEQKFLLSQKQEHLAALERKIHDLLYEMNELFPQEEIDGIAKEDSFSYLVTVAIKFMEKIETVKYPTSPKNVRISSQFSQWKSFCIHGRPFFNHIKKLHRGIVFVFSPQENRTLFYHEHPSSSLSKQLQEMLSSSQICVENCLEERSNPNSMAHQKIGTLTVKDHINQQEQPYHCFMHTMQSGPLKNYLFSILHPQS